MVKELWYRHLIKTGTWRIIAFLALGVISYILTGSLALATSIALADWLIKTVLYLGHEMIWSKLNIGRQSLSCKKGVLLWFTGLSGSGKTTLADEVAKRLEKRMVKTKRLDGDVARRTFSNNLGFSTRDRAENCRRAAHVGLYLRENNIVLASFISPYSEIQRYLYEIGAQIVHVDCPIDECAKRDPKGMYSQLEDGKFKGSPFTGMHKDAPYQDPAKMTSLVVKTDELSLDESAAKVILFLEVNGYI
jgi:adenylylsulfate kinase